MFVYPAETGGAGNFCLTLSARPTKMEDVRLDSSGAFSHFVFFYRKLTENVFNVKTLKVVPVLY
jgi:hypothetical protein